MCHLCTARHHSRVGGSSGHAERPKHMQTQAACNPPRVVGEEGVELAPAVALEGVAPRGGRGGRPVVCHLCQHLWQGGTGELASSQPEARRCTLNRKGPRSGPPEREPRPAGVWGAQPGLQTNTIPHAQV